MLPSHRGLKPSPVPQKWIEKNAGTCNRNVGSKGCNVFILLPNLVAEGLDRSLTNRFLGTIKTVCAFSEPVITTKFFLVCKWANHAPSHASCLTYLQLSPPHYANLFILLLPLHSPFDYQLLNLSIPGIGAINSIYWVPWNVHPLN